MLIGDKKTTIAYRCPRCGGGVMGISSELALSGGRLLKLKCPCGESHMTVANAGEDKLRVTVPCLLCNDDHRFLVSARVFYGRELFLLNCAYSNLDVAFIGEEERVSAALTDNEEQLREIFRDAGLSSLAGLHPSDGEERPLLPDAQVLDVVRFLVRELEADGQIDCPCHNGEYEIAFTDEGVRVFCLNCEGEHVFPVNSLEAAQSLLSCDRLVLSEKGDQDSPR